MQFSFHHAGRAMKHLFYEGGLLVFSPLWKFDQITNERHKGIYASIQLVIECCGAVVSIDLHFEGCFITQLIKNLEAVREIIYFQAIDFLKDIFILYSQCFKVVSLFPYCS